MHLRSVPVGILLAGSAIAQDAPAPAPAPKSYIIEYSSSTLHKRQEEISNTDGIEVVRTFDSEVFRGVSVTTDKFNSDDLNGLEDVVRVWLNEEIPLAPITIHSYSEDASAFNYTTHVATGVSKLHEQGILGKGVTVGVVDTGIYYPHEALGGGLGEGFKVVGGYDFIGDGDWPFEPADPDDDPLDYRGHGTHVAGIIAGKTEFWQGVAPEASLKGYKVFANEYASTSTDILIAAFIRAYEDGCDVINASIGGANGWSENAWAEVASRLVELGVVVVISAGNSGANGPFYGSSGSSGKNVLAIASVETEDFPASPFEATFTLDGEANVTTVGYLPSTDYFPPSVKDWPIVALSLDTSVADDACTRFPAGTPSLEGSIPLVRRGGCSFSVKQANLEALGAEYILIYNSDTSPLIIPSTDRLTSLLGMITADAGEAIVNTIAEGGEVTGDFSRNPEEVVAVEYNVGGRPSTFTSWAGLYDLQQKPDIAGPGGNIFSSWSDGGYSTISGTSMAAPYVAGVAALWVSAHGGRDANGVGFAKKLHERIISSGVSVPWYDGTLTNFDYPAPVAQVGNGLVNAWKVLTYDTRLEFDKIALNDTRYFNRYHDVTIVNDGDETVSYTWAVEHSGGLEAIGWLPSSTGIRVKRIKKYAELRPLTLEAKVSLPKAFKLAPGEKKTVSVNFDNPDKLGWNATGLPVYGGKVQLSGSNGEHLSVPFFGVGADLRRQLTPLSEAGYPLSVSGPSNTPITSDSTYTFDLSVAAQDFPKIYSKLLWGSREIRWDIYEAGWTERKWSYPPVVGENGYVGTATGWAGASSVLVFDPAIHDADDTFSFPVQNTFRNVDAPTRYYWFGKLGNGTQIADGRYVMRFAALKPFGHNNPSASDNWEVYKTPTITVTSK